MHATAIPLTEDHTSSLISGDGYDESTGTLAIRFRSNGDIWHYPGVSPETWESYQKAESKGSFFHRVIKKNIKGAKAS